MTARSSKVIEAHDRQVRRLVRANDGHVVKSQGDGFMVAFADPAAAVRCGVAMQHALQRDAKRLRNNSIRVRIGIHMGKSVRRGDDLFRPQRGDGRPRRRAGRRRGDPVSEPVRNAVGDEQQFDGGRDAELGFRRHPPALRRHRSALIQKPRSGLLGIPLRGSDSTCACLCLRLGLGEALVQPAADLVGV